jgi:hypothetical protein
VWAKRRMMDYPRMTQYLSMIMPGGTSVLGAGRREGGDQATRLFLRFAYPIFDTRPKIVCNISILRGNFSPSNTTFAYWAGHARYFLTPPGAGSICKAS